MCRCCGCVHVSYVCVFLGVDDYGGAYGQHMIGNGYGYDHGYEHGQEYVQSVGGYEVDTMQSVYIAIFAFIIATCMCIICAVMCGGIGAITGYFFQNKMERMSVKQRGYAIVEKVDDESEV